MNCRPNGHKKGGGEVGGFSLQSFCRMYCNAHARYFVTPTSVVLNLFQHLNFGPEAVLEDWVLGSLIDLRSSKPKPKRFHDQHQCRNGRIATFAKRRI
jgi:hypothetical protein